MTVRIVKTRGERVDDLEPLWASLRAYHRQVADEMSGIPIRDVEDSWPRRRTRYVEWLADPDAFVLIAEDDGVPVGYALVSLHGADDTHVTGDRVGELQTLVVEPGYRGKGLGTRFLERVYEELRSLGVREMLIGVLAGNDDALRLYERHGFRPWVIVTLGRIPDP